MPQIIDQQGNPAFRTGIFESMPIVVTDVGGPRRFSIIAAVDLDAGYVKNGEIPWYYSEDFKWFKGRTEKAICVMGRKTYEDICKRLGDKSAASVLPGRTCYVVSSKLKNITNATVIESLTDLNKHLTPDDMREVMVIGGGLLFKEAISKANTVYLTTINDRHECDGFFPIAYLLKHFGHVTTYKGKEEKLRYTVWQRKL